MDATTVVALLPPLTYAVFAVTERRWPARAFPPRHGWQWIGIGFLLLIGTVGTVVPVLLPVAWLETWRFIDGTRLGVTGGVVAGFVVLELAMYAWHRSAHGVGFLWRGFHQLHHSPRRVDIPGSVLFHPLEMTVQVTLQIFVTVVVLGLEPLAAAIIGYLVAFAGMFQHWNVRTPPWIGYLIQRPEAHCVHHRLGVHDYNYADLPAIDLLFGTFRNPRQYLAQCGFEAGADRRIGAMLALCDVNEGLYGPRSRGLRPVRATPPRAVTSL
jgi:sterol desaturase/sphingolipid hydroxylase (fatty acid hydroxylase superfamily)